MRFLQDFRLRIIAPGLLGGALISAALGYALSGSAASPYMKVEEVKPGMKGHGLTVFSGTKPTRFNVEVISTLHNFRPDQDLIIIKTDHPRLDVARTVAGMSGSPIYINGKMIGAYAYGWLFNVEPIAGVTPIHSMLSDLRRPVPPALAPRSKHRGPLPAMHNKHAGRSVARPLRFRGAPLAYDVKSHAAQVSQHTHAALAAPQGSNLSPASTDVMVGGLGPASFKLANELLAPAGFNLIQSGGGQGKSATGDAQTYVDGGAISVELVRGDISLSGLGTVTHVVGNKLVAFGHPMFNGGLENLPTALARIHWVLSTQNRSFKIGEPIKPLGALINDRQASIVVDTTRTAPTFPLTVNIEGAPGAPHPDWQMEVAHDQFLAPSFTAVAIGSALETTTAERSDMTWRATSKVNIVGHGDMVLEDFGSGAGRPVGPNSLMRSRLVTALGAVLNNPWQMGQIARVDTKVRVQRKRETMRLRGAKVLEPEIDAGSPARIRLTLQPYHGPEITRLIEVPISAKLAGKTVRLVLAPGYRVNRTVPEPTNFSELLHVLPALTFPAETLIATYKIPEEAGAAFEGKLASRLPPGAVDTLQSTSQSITPQIFAAVHQTVIPFKGFIIGQNTVTIKVREVLK